MFDLLYAISSHVYVAYTVRRSFRGRVVFLPFRTTSLAEDSFLVPLRSPKIRI